jgi:hypothetical protein
LKNDQFVRQRSGLPPDVPGAYAVRDGLPHDVAIQHRGDPGQPGEVVPRAAIAALAGGTALDIPEGQSGRLQLAQWLTDPRNPLTARVMVNRIWQHHFGRGLVETPSNFGTRGAPPTHPELLDYLAASFVESGWSVKALHRLILTSRTWQLAATDDPANAAIDTGNAYYWRHDRVRLEAEPIRDAMLAVSGLLDLQRPGAHPFPPTQDWHWTQHNQFREAYASRHRSVYLMTQRLQKHPFLGLFDEPDTNSSTGRRSVSTVPPQSLYLMNSPEMQEIAGAFAARVMSAAGGTQSRIEAAQRWCFARAATGDELATGAAYLEQYQLELGSTDVPPVDREHAAWTSYARLLLGSNEFFYLD